MKRLLALLSMAVFLTFTGGGPVFAATTFYANVPASTPNDISYTMLYSADTNETKDTFATTDIHVHGPYGLTNAYTTPMFSGFAIVAQATSGTAANFSIDYQLIAGTKLKDTLKGAWVAACTTSDAKAVNCYVSLANQAGRSVVFRVNKYGSNAGYINGYLKILWKNNAMYSTRP